MLAALQAGVAAGGEAGPVHSAALLVVADVPWPIVNLRVDWVDEDPMGALERLWQAYRPQLQDYLDRALRRSSDPRWAHSSGCGRPIARNCRITSTARSIRTSHPAMEYRGMTDEQQS